MTNTGCGNGGGCQSQGNASSCTENGEISQNNLAYSLSRIRYKILVMSGKGGVGKSTVAANMALSLSLQGKKVGLLDIDFHGPSIPTIMGLTGKRAQGSEQKLEPVEIGALKVMSLAFLLDNDDAAVIWRGPMKMGVIQKLLGDVNWGELDYLIIDSPPGTGDEPLSVCQSIPDISGAVIVTTPQQVAVADVRRSVNFCRQLEMPILGVIENMSGFACPKCGEITDIFKSGGGENMSNDMHVPFLGAIPLEVAVAESGDDGKPCVYHNTGTVAAKVINTALETIKSNIEKKPDESGHERFTGENKMRYAIPLAEGKLAMHFGHCQEFALIDVDEKNKKITSREDLTPPPHEPGVLPRWLGEHKVTHIIAGGMGQRAQGLFAEQNIKVIVGAPSEKPENLVKAHLEEKLASGENICDH